MMSKTNFIDTETEEEIQGRGARTGEKDPTAKTTLPARAATPRRTQNLDPREVTRKAQRNRLITVHPARKVTESQSQEAAPLLLTPKDQRRAIAEQAQTQAPDRTSPKRPHSLSGVQV